MKKIAKIIFKIHRLLYKYPTRSEIRLVIQDVNIPLDSDWFIGMVYLCGDSIEKIAKYLEMSEQEVRDKLNKMADEVVL